MILNRKKSLIVLTVSFSRSKQGNIFVSLEPLHMSYVLHIHITSLIQNVEVNQVQKQIHLSAKICHHLSVLEDLSVRDGRHVTARYHKN